MPQRALVKMQYSAHREIYMLTEGWEKFKTRGVVAYEIYLTKGKKTTKFCTCDDNPRGEEKEKGPDRNGSIRGAPRSVSRNACDRTRRLEAGSQLSTTQPGKLSYLTSYDHPLCYIHLIFADIAEEIERYREARAATSRNSSYHGMPGSRSRHLNFATTYIEIILCLLSTL